MTKYAALSLTLLVLATLSSVECSLEPGFYDRTCPGYEATVASTVAKFLWRDPTVAPGLLRMFFHDCFVRGCDASVLLNRTKGVPAEKEAPPNLSLHGFDVIDAIKAQFEKNCKGIVSCSDILATATRDAVFMSSGLFWHLNLGRRDGNVSLASEVDLPSPFEDTNTLIRKFKDKGLNAKEMTLLQGGGHSIGIGHCPVVAGRLSNFNNTGAPDPTMDPGYVRILSAKCNRDSNAALDNDPVTPKLLDKQYFVNLKNRLGLFTSDQELLFDKRTSGTIETYAAATRNKFNQDFGDAMVKLSEVEVLTGSKGSIRSTCAIARRSGARIIEKFTGHEAV